MSVVIGIVFIGFPAVSSWGGSFPAARTVTVVAEGKTLATPDIAELSFSVVSQGKNPDDLSESNNQKMNAVNNFVKAQGISDKDMKTTSYTLSPDYQYNPMSQRNFITGYTLTQTLTIKVRDLTKVAKIIAGLTPLGVNQIGGVNFTVEDQEKVLADARRDAITKAQAKAEAMAEEMGVGLGRVMNVTEYTSGPIPYLAMAAPRGKEGAESFPTVSSIQPGTMEVKLDVQIIYQLR